MTTRATVLSLCRFTRKVLFRRSTNSRELIEPQTMAHIQLSAIVTPIVATRGKPWRGRLIVVDQFHRKHKTQKIEFKWVSPEQAPPKREK